MDELENIQVELVLDSTELQLEENDLECKCQYKNVQF